MPFLYGGVDIPGHPHLDNIQRLDILPIPMLGQMHRLGIAVDIPYLQDLSSRLSREMDGLKKDIASYIPSDRLQEFSDLAAEIEDEQGSADFNPNSAEQIRSLLYDTLHVGSGKDIKITGSGKKTTGKKQLELLRDEHPVVKLILDYRERSKLKSAFTDSLPLKAKLHPRGNSCPVCELPHDSDTWRVHTSFLTTRAETGRFSSKNPNLQQIPARTELGGLVRAAFIASPGKRLVSRDLSQIELRNLAHVANAASMIQVYAEDKDIHLYTACRTFNKDYDHYARLSNLKDQGKLPPELKPDWLDFALNCRLPSKNINFMIVYGATWRGLQAQLALSGIYWDESQCIDFIRRWFNLYPEVHSLMDVYAYRARRYGLAWDVFGRIRRVPEVRSCHEYIRSQGVRQAGNMPIQSVSAGQMKLIMAKLQEYTEEFQADDVFVWPLLTIHDQLIFEAEEEAVPGLEYVMEEGFNNVMRDEVTGEDYWRVPIKSDGEVLTRWKKE